MARPTGFDNGFAKGFGGPNTKGYLQIITPVLTGSYEDGDILSAVPWRRVRQERAEGLCFAKTIVDGKRMVDRLVNGLYPAGDIAEDYLATTTKFKFERLAPGQGRITRLSDMDTIDFTSNVPFTQHDGKTVQMDIDQFLLRRKATLVKPGGAGRPIFGDAGVEYWYGGGGDYSDINLNTVWAAIESKTPYLESVECDKAHFSDYRKRLIIAVDNFDDDTANSLTAPKTEIESVTIDSVSTVGNTYELTLSQSVPALASNPEARLISGNSEWPVLSGSGFTLIVDFGDPISTGPIDLRAETARRGNKVEWRNLRDVVESDVIDKKVDVRIDQIRKHVRSEIVQNKS